MRITASIPATRSSVYAPIDPLHSVDLGGYNASVLASRSHRSSHRHRDNRWLRTALAVGAVFALGALHASATHAASRPEPESWPTPRWKYAEASYYTLFGNRTACGRTASPDAWFVASLKRDTAKCGLQVRLCNGVRCVNVTVQDLGAWRGDDRRFDLQPRVKRALGCGDLCRVKWRKGWAR